jgi:pSer/pThr/pTyr-binding forkhead associated (FHA) protein
MNLKTIYRIGAADDADIVIKQSTVSKNHCELRWTERGWQLRDLDSTNGTFVDGKRLTEPCYVTDKQRLTLGRDVPLTLPNNPVLKSPSPQSVSTPYLDLPTHSSPKTPYGLLIAGSIGTAALLLLATIVVSFSGKGKNDQANEMNSSLESGGNASSIADKKMDSTPIPASDSTATKASTKLDEETVSVAEDSSFWAILVESADGKSQRLVGTAVAIETNRLIALASIAEAIEEVKESFPKVFLRQAQQPNVRLQPSQILIHPSFKKALSQLTEFELQLNEKIKGVESMSEPSIQESLEWSGKLEDIMFELAKSDLACITTATPLKKFSTLATSTTSQGSESGAICGYPMIVPSPIITDNLKTFLLDGKASFRLDSKTKTPALYVETRDFPGIPLISMVCLNQKSQVIGICVKEEPVQGVGDPKRCQISGIEVFWK